ncbi:MAG: phosphoribosylformylglycinamidine synthase subunit PurQ [Gemmatimonadaceae bacterium]|jgi:phosphoribosylformylglycinamidine synthase|nr:phosphoribosylformylglycinamidine synthase subunit PurQ [Gemmatimonadaceae bacterium]
MKVGVVTFPGSNCDDDAVAAVAAVGAVPIRLWHKGHDLEGAEAIVLPGGFSYGDYLRAGAIARFAPIMREVVAFAERGGPVIGICNGFQILCEAHLLPGALLRNDSLQFRSETVALRVETTATRFTARYRPGQVLRIPIAHGDGRYTADAETLATLEGENRVVFRYVRPDGTRDDAAATPNGAMHAIAGIVNAAGNVLGMMPHPERALDAALGSADGLPLFESLFAAVAA